MRIALTQSNPWLRHTQLALGLLLAATITAGCSSSNNKHNNTPASPPAASASASASSIATRPPASGSPVARAPTAGATLPPAGTPSAELVAAAKKLQPLLLQTADLPAGERDFQAGNPVPVGNDDLVRTHPDAAAQKAQFDQAGRLGGVFTAWAKPGGQVTADTKSLYQVSCLLSAYRDSAGAKQGYDLTLAQIRNTPTTQGASTSTISDLAPAGAGANDAAFRQDQAITSSGGTPPQLFTVHEILYIEVWQRSSVVATCQFSAIGEDPPLGDFQQIVHTQDAHLQSGGY